MNLDASAPNGFVALKICLLKITVCPLYYNLMACILSISVKCAGCYVGNGLDQDKERQRNVSNGCSNSEEK